MVTLAHAQHVLVAEGATHTVAAITQSHNPMVKLMLDLGRALNYIMLNHIIISYHIQLYYILLHIIDGRWLRSPRLQEKGRQGGPLAGEDGACRRVRQLAEPGEARAAALVTAQTRHMTGAGTGKSTGTGMGAATGTGASVLWHGMKFAWVIGILRPIHKVIIYCQFQRI